ncbi:MAG: cytochrome c biogenesis protein CcsA [Sutterellaceae bacterium]|nr:cytochrome c biogenesis protein CcsA [Burkholderiaceae bacterium]MDW8429598.1 cytochrome c biogenesis protein CcsA [Sutterellaceae bacterium]
MQANAFYVAAHGVVACAYGALAWLAWRALQRPHRFDGRWLLPIVALAHATLLAGAVLDHGALRFGFAQALSATMLFAVLIVWLEGFVVPIRGLQVLVLPVAAVASVLPALFQGALIAVGRDSLAFRAHWFVAIAAFSLITIAALHALLMASMDRSLHAAADEGAFARVLAEVPPLLAMERLLFRLLWTGFLLLTAALISGVLFTEELFGRPLRFDHKTVFTIASWLIFAGLLAGRQLFGWRGRTALRFTLVGFVLLLLAYVGSRFVLEVILRRVAG